MNEGMGVMPKVLVVGAGVAGCTAARVLAERGCAVVVVERRSHIGGNAYDERDENGITVQRYGPHIFHTNYKDVWDFLSRFTSWRYYQHRVLSYVHGMLVPVPINIDTINSLYGMSLNAETVDGFYARRRIPIEAPSNLREAAVSQVGEELYDLMFKNYTLKQWGVDGEKLPAAIFGRVPTRSNRDSRYFTDRYQGIPRRGFTAMFTGMLRHPNIELRLNCEYCSLPETEKILPTFYSGSIDELFDFRFGRLPYRSLRFEFKTYKQEWHQPVAVVNYPNDYDFTRATEFKHFTGETSPRTTLVYEYPVDGGKPYYPMPTPEAAEHYAQYVAVASCSPHIRLMGRLGMYKYMNMDQVVKTVMELCTDSFRVGNTLEIQA